jgi:hypothetical protein
VPGPSIKDSPRAELGYLKRVDNPVAQVTALEAFLFDELQASLDGGVQLVVAGEAERLSPTMTSGMALNGHNRGLRFPGWIGMDFAKYLLL